jgi:Dihydroorotate dehydrogenase
VLCRHVTELFKEAGGKRQEAGDRGQEAGGRGQGAGGRGQGAGGRGQGAGGKGQEAGGRKVAKLAVEIAGIRLENPVLPAAGPPVWNGEAMKACAAGGAGALVSKTVSVHPAAVPTPNMAEIPGGFLNTELWSELPVEQFIEREYPLAKETGLPLIVSIGYTPEEIAALAPLVRPFADALELSTHYIGDDPGPMIEAIHAAKAAVDVPVFVKLSPFRGIL